jgi:hypothetical protein
MVVEIWGKVMDWHLRKARWDHVGGGGVAKMRRAEMERRYV